MGGRNYVPKSLRLIGNELPPSRALVEATTFAELQRWGKDKFGEDFYLDEYVKRNGDVEKVKSFLIGVESTANQYPGTKLSKVRMEYGGDNYIAYAFGNTLTMNSRYYGKRSKANIIEDMGVEVGWSPNIPNINDKSAHMQQVGAHEMMHVVDNRLGAIMKRNKIGEEPTERSTRGAKMAIDKAIEMEIKASRREGKSKTTLVNGTTRELTREEYISRNISRYATKNNFETLAEARADVFSNGANASRLSKNIISEFTKIYQKYNE